MGTKCNKLLLLIWKNCKLQIRHPCHTTIEILAPVFFCLLLVMVRSAITPQPMPDGWKFTPFSPEIQAIEGSKIAWAPCNQQLGEIMKKFAQNLPNGMTEKCLSSGRELEDFLMADPGPNFAGIEFPDYMKYLGNVLDRNVSVIFRFPAELRALDPNVTLNEPEKNWKTDRMFPELQVPGPRNRYTNDGAFPNYNREGFLFLQKALAAAIMQQFQPNSKMPEIEMQRFPYPPWVDDNMLPVLQPFVGLMLLCSFVTVAIYTVSAITNEKETQIKEAMKIMGLPNWLHWTAWFIKSFSVLLITTILIMCILKLNVLKASGTFVVLLMLILYVCATITLCFAISVFFSNAYIASILAGVIWFLMYFPYMLQSQSLNMLQYLLICLCSNSALALAFDLVIRFEGFGDGLQWSNLWHGSSPDDKLVIGHMMLMLAFDAVLYLCIALYVEGVFPGKYGVPRQWYFPVSSGYWNVDRRSSRVSDVVEVAHNSSVYETEPPDLPVGIAIQNLSKVYRNNKVALSDLSLNVFQGQITALLGHNGAGKTTAMSILTGMFPPTTGTARVNGHDIRTSMHLVRQSLGLCPQNNIYYDELTVEEHLYFFSKLKGLSNSEAKREVKKYLTLLGLQGKRKARAKTLSGGTKRKLCIGIALCGNSKVVFLDEPTAGVDPASRRYLWDLLRTEKENRTIVLSTHFMDEADLLGDRIAIMVNGKLQCYGSSFFLKKKYGAGYHLVIDKAPNCDPKAVTSLLEKHIPSVEMEMNIGSELSYLLKESHTSHFTAMLRDLEDHGPSLGVKSFGISLTTLEEVFLKVGVAQGEDAVNSKRGRGIQFEFPDELHATGYLTGCKLKINQLRAMILKRCLSTYRSLATYLLLIFLTIMFVAFTFLKGGSLEDLPNLPISLWSYEEPVTAVSTSPNNKYYESYVNFVRNEKLDLLDMFDGDMDEIISNKAAENIGDFRRRYIIGATFHDGDKITGWFNNEPYHSPPLSLQYVLNSVLVKEVGVDYSIQFSNHPQPYTLDTKFSEMRQGDSLGFQLSFNVGFVMAFVSAFFILFPIKERVCNAKHLQFVSGVDVFIFWGVHYLWDLLSFIVIALFALFTLMLFQEEGFKTFSDLGRVFYILLLYGLSVIPLAYLVSYLFSVPTNGYSFMATFNIFTGMIPFWIVEALTFPGSRLKPIGDILNYVFLLFPQYGLSSGLMNVYTTYSLHHKCQSFVKACVSNSDGAISEQLCQKLLCTSYTPCCDLNLSYYAWEAPGIGKNVVFSLVTALVFFLLLLLMDSRLLDGAYYFLCGLLLKPRFAPEATDSDVQEERKKIGEMRQEEIQNYTLMLQNVTKRYGKLLAVDDLCLGVNKYECFGLLGVNGAGKTTTFKMMTGDVRITYGDIWVNGMNLKKRLKRIHEVTGYCPQFDAILDNLTGRETLWIYALMRGIAYSECRKVGVKLAKRLDFHEHLDKKVLEYSGGNKRKLSTAIALIGEPQVIYLDEPTTGMDPATKRHIWNDINRITDAGKCVILTSHSMEECEALCTRLAIMVNGQFKCLGSPQHLKSKFSQGFMLTIKMQKSDDAAPPDTQPIEAFVAKTFPNAQLREKHRELLTYYIAFTDTKWSQAFGVMEDVKGKFRIEDYSLGQCSLEQVFLLFARDQIN